MMVIKVAVRLLTPEFLEHILYAELYKFCTSIMTRKPHKPCGVSIVTIPIPQRETWILDDHVQSHRATVQWFLIVDGQELCIHSVKWRSSKFYFFHPEMYKYFHPNIFTSTSFITPSGYLSSASTFTRYNLSNVWSLSFLWIFHPI